MGMLKEFREFAVKGNVIDLAVGIIIGAAFGKIVDSLVKDVVMPVINAVFGGAVDFSNKYCRAVRQRACRAPRSMQRRRAASYSPGAASSPYC